jgi:hypothetical protein
LSGLASFLEPKGPSGEIGFLLGRSSDLPGALVRRGGYRARSLCQQGNGVSVKSDFTRGPRSVLYGTKEDSK